MESQDKQGRADARKEARERLLAVLAKDLRQETLDDDEQRLLDGHLGIEKPTQSAAGVDDGELRGLVVDLLSGDDDTREAAQVRYKELKAQQQGVLEWRPEGRIPPVAWLLRTLGSVKAEGDGLRHRHAGDKGRQFGSAWMPDHTVTLFTGQGGVGKSRLALQLAVHVARGGGGGLSVFGGVDDQSPALWTNRNEKGKVINRSGKVIYACWETRRAAFWHRAEAVSSRQGGEGHVQEGVPDIAYVDMKRMGALWGVAQGEHVARRGDWLPAADWLLAQAVEVEADLLILDPLAGVYMQSENDRGLVRAFLSSLDAWCEENRCAVLLIAHPPKSGQHAYAGSTDWHAGVQCLWELKTAQELKKPEGGGRKELGDKLAENGQPVLQLSVEKLNEDLRPQAIELVYHSGRYVEYDSTPTPITDEFTA